MHPTTIDEATALLAHYPGAMVLAGGTDAMVEINDGHSAAGGLSCSGEPDCCPAILAARPDGKDRDRWCWRDLHRVDERPDCVAHTGFG